MNIPQLFMLFIGTAILNNFVLYRFLGICPFLGMSKRLDSAIGMGLAVTFVLMGASIVSWPVDQFMIKFDITFLRIIAFIIVIAAFVQMLEFIIKKMNPALYKAFGIYLALITTNCIVLAVVLINSSEGYNLIEAIIYACGSGMGFTLALVLMAGIRERLELADIPKPLRGVPIAFLVTGLLAIAFSGFSGMG